jgi:pyridoxine kinase
MAAPPDAARDASRRFSAMLVAHVFLARRLMSRILAISSQVARGHVGLSAVVPALQRLGHDVVALPTVLLSNHPAHERCAGERIGVEILARMLDALAANGWLGEIAAVMTGYLPSLAHVYFAAEAVKRVRAVRPAVLVLCDPILGDDPKGLYVEEAAAVGVSDDLLPLADIVTPNRFELAWLAGGDFEDIGSAVAAARTLPVAATLATSIPAPPDRLGNVLVSGGEAHVCQVARRPRAPHGTGDLFSGLVLGHRLRGASLAQALAAASAGVEVAVAMSEGCDELALVPALDAIARAPPLALTCVM